MPAIMSDDRVKAVLAQISDDETVDLARELVRIPSITGQEGRDISDRMLSWLRDAGLDAGQQEIQSDRINVWARVDGERPGTRLLFNGHLDTKPVDNMTVDPYSAEIKEGRLFGRGACDMKSAVAAAMIATRAVKRAGIPLAGSMIFGSEVGEEGGGWRLVDLVDGPCQCDAIVCCEPTDMELHLGSRGGFPIEVETKGLATHTGTAYKGINAIEKMTGVIQAMYGLPHFHRVDPIWGRSPINAMEIHGGGKVTASVADDCLVRFDIRLNPDLEPAELQSALDELFARLRAQDPQLDVSWRFRSLVSANSPGVNFSGGRAAAVIAPEHPLVKAVLDGAEAATGHRPAFGGFPGGCSQGVLMRRDGTPGVIIGPGNLEQAHGAIEWIELEQVRSAARVYAAMAAVALDPARAG
jgi:acetylornithine deacetylase/succinyl-diaminopimelate desuccinylase-like protein